MSKHSVDVVRVVKEPHPNANALSIVRIQGFSVVVRSDDWQDGDLAAYIEPDYMVPADRDEFKFIGAFSKVIVNNGVTGFRIKPKKLRGIQSMGILIKAPEGSSEGDDVRELLGVARYEAPVEVSTGGEVVSPPKTSDGFGVDRPVYDVESIRRNMRVLQEGERVVITEKIDGANARYTFIEGEGLYCGSRREWKRESDSDMWWQAMRATPGLRELCEANPGVTVYGEVYGRVQDLRYNIPDRVAFVAFDVLGVDGNWLNWEDMKKLLKSFNVPIVPRLYYGPWSDELINLADGNSPLAQSHSDAITQIREGVIVRPLVERYDDRVGRVQLKIVSNDYLERA